MTPQQIAELLPGILREGVGDRTPLGALVAAMAAAHGSVDQGASHLPDKLDSWRADAPFVGLLARWVGVYEGMAADEVCQRNLVSQAARLWRRRGTEQGIVAVLEVATGVRGYRVQRGSEPFSLVVVAPARAQAQRSRVERIVLLMKPIAVLLEDIRFVEPEEPVP